MKKRVQIDIMNTNTNGIIRILTIGIDVFRHKNLNKTQSLVNHDVSFVVIPMETAGVSIQTEIGEQNLKIVSINRRYRRLSAFLALVRILSKQRIDIVEIYPESYITLGFYLISRLFQKPVVVIARGLEHRIADRRIRGFKLWILAIVYRGADLVIYNELYMTEVLRDRLGVTSLEFLPNSVDVPPACKELKDHACNFLFMNSIKFFRHPEVALEAFIRLKELKVFPFDSQVRLRIVGLRQHAGFHGNADRESKLAEMIRGRDISVELLPWTEESEEHLNWADVFLLPADLVFLNYALLEAMARGIPVIVQDTPGTERVVTDGIEGFVVGPTPESWLAPMTKLAVDHKLRRRMGSAARERVIQQFSSASMARSWLQHYNSAIHNHKGIRAVGANL